MKGPYKDGSVDVRVQGRYAKMMLPEDHEDHISVHDLDLEELARGQLKDKNGKFTGRPPRLLPREIVDAMRNEHHKRVNGILEQSLPDQVKNMIEIAQNRRYDPAVRLKASIYVYERFMGRTPEKVNITAETTVQDIVDDILYEVGEAQQSAVEKEIEETREELERVPKRRTPGQRMQARKNR
jgi:hypothetical protein